jgi:hypothetical protein
LLKIQIPYNYSIFNLLNAINEEKFELTETVISYVVLPSVESSQRNQRYTGHSTAEGHPIHFQELPVKETQLNKETQITIMVTDSIGISQKRI